MKEKGREREQETCQLQHDFMMYLALELGAIVSHSRLGDETDL